MTRERATLRLRRRLASALSAPSIAPSRSPESQWFWDHYEVAAQQIIDMFGHENITLADHTVADIGCGDGIIDLGVLHKARPRTLVGFDVNLTNTDYLQRRAQEEGVNPNLGRLQFAQSSVDRLPAEDGAFEYAFSWSAFEHISLPVAVLEEIRRVLSPHGAFFLQLWPFYFSANGSHLWDWYPEPFHHLKTHESAIVAELASSDVKPEEWTQLMSREFTHLNRLTLAQLERSLLAAGFSVRSVELITGRFSLTPDLARYSWLDLGISGIKLIAVPAQR